MAFFTPSAAPYVNGPPPWPHGGHFNRLFHDDSGYASEDSDSEPFPPLLDPDSMYEDNDRFDQYPPCTRRHRATAFVDAQWSRPVALRTCHPPHDPCNDSRRIYDLPPSLAFEQQQHRYSSQPDAWLNPTTTSYHREPFGCEPAFRQDLGATTSPLDIEEHCSRVPDTLPPLNNRVESEREQSLHFSSSSSSSSPIQHHSPSPSRSADVKTKTPPSPAFAAQCVHRPSSSSSSSAPLSDRQHQHHHLSPNRYYHDEGEEEEEEKYLATAWQQLYRERKALEREKRALEQHMGRWPCSNSSDNNGRRRR